MDYYREYFSVAGIFENKPYEGVCELLSGLKERGYTAIVATSKPEQFAKAIVQHFGLEQYFKEICGATMDQSRTQKADVIAYALKKCEIKDKKRAVMVGDRKHDIIGAHENKIPCVGVLYGYGTEDELKQYQADYLVASVEELTELLK